MKKKPELTSDYVQKRIAYHPATGLFTWLSKEGAERRIKAWNARYAGTIAGRVSKGRRIISIDKRHILASRLAWLVVYGEMPDRYIDHKDRDTLNDRIGNLRLATNSQNLANAAVPRHNTSGVKGVASRGNKWAAFIQVEKRQRYLGLYETKAQAAEAYILAAQKHFGEFASTGDRA